MRKLLIGLTAAAALALAVPGAAMAENHGGGHGGGGHASSGGHSGGGSASRGMSSRSSGMSSRGMSSRGMSRSVQGNRGISARGMHANRGMSARSHRANRNFVSNRSMNSRLARSNVNTSRANRQAAVNGRHHHRHHRHHRGGGWWNPGYAYYDDYAGYDTCYQYAWTARGYRYVNTCAPDYYYGAY